MFEIADDEMSVRLQGSTEAQREQIENWARLVGTEQRYIQLYLVPDDAEPWKKTDPDELIQATGRDGRMTVELFRLQGNEIRAYVVGRSDGVADASPTESVFNGDNEYKVLPSEVWSPEEMTALLLRYRAADGDLDSDGLALREQAEFRRVVQGPTNAGNMPVASTSTATASDDTSTSAGVATGIRTQSAADAKGEKRIERGS